MTPQKSYCAIERYSGTDRPILVLGLEAVGHYPRHLKAIASNSFSAICLTPEELWRRAFQHSVNNCDYCFIAPGSSPKEIAFQAAKIIKSNIGLDTIILLDLWSSRHIMSNLRAILGVGYKKLSIRGILIPREFCYVHITWKCYIRHLLWWLWLLSEGRRAGPEAILTLEQRTIDASRWWPSLRGKIGRLPEPYDVGSIDTGILAARDPRCILLFFGHQTNRKGLVWALDALRHVALKAHIVIAGKIEQEEKVAGYIKLLPKSYTVEILSGYVSDAQKEALFKSATTIVLPYDFFFGSSGILMESVIYNIPFISSNCSLIVQEACALGLGVSYRPGSISDFCGKLQQALITLPRAEHRSEFLQRHGSLLFTQALLKTG